MCFLKLYINSKHKNYYTEQYANSIKFHVKMQYLLQFTISNGSSWHTRKRTEENKCMKHWFCSFEQRNVKYRKLPSTA